jgi:hypothetical protein
MTALKTKNPFLEGKGSRVPFTVEKRVNGKKDNFYHIMN